MSQLESLLDDMDTVLSATRDEVQLLHDKLLLAEKAIGIGKRVLRAASEDGSNDMEAALDALDIAIYDYHHSEEFPTDD